MENQTLTKIIDSYFAYWQEYLKPLEEREKERYLHFCRLINRVGKRFYGSDFTLQFNFRILQDLSQPSATAVSDPVG